MNKSIKLVLVLVFASAACAAKPLVTPDELVEMLVQQHIALTNGVPLPTSRTLEEVSRYNLELVVRVEKFNAGLRRLRDRSSARNQKKFDDAVRKRGYVFGCRQLSVGVGTEQARTERAIAAKDKELAEKKAAGERDEKLREIRGEGLRRSVKRKAEGLRRPAGTLKPGPKLLIQTLLKLIHLVVCCA